MLRPLALFLGLITFLQAADQTLQTLFTRPLLWGTPPEQITWSKRGHTLVFVWNANGRRFKDLYAYHADRQELVRLTDLEFDKDPLNVIQEEKDERLKPYLLPAPGIVSFDVSYDGTQAAFSYKGDLYVVPTDGKSKHLRLTRTQMPEVAPLFSPDGKKLASMRLGQLFVQELATGQIWQATDVQGASLTAYRWSPDGKSFVYMTERGTSRTLAIPNFSGQFVSIRSFRRSVAGDDPTDFDFFLVPSEGGKTIKLETGLLPGQKGAADIPEFSPDSSKLVTQIALSSWKKKSVVVIDTKTAKAKTLYEESDPRWVDYGWAGFSPDSKTVLFTSESDGWSHLHTVPVEGGPVQQITRGTWEIHKEPFSEYPQWAGNWIYYSSTEVSTSERHTYRVRPDGSGKERLSTREGINSVLVTEDGEFIASREADLNNPLDLFVRSSASGAKEHRVTESPQPGFYKHQWPETKFVSFPSKADGRLVAAKILLPPGYKLGDRNQRPYPAVLFIHGAGYATSVLKQWGSYHDVRFAYNTYLASKGYVILDMDYRGSTGYGKDWRAAVYLNMGGPDLEDVMGGVEYLKTLGNIDMKRLGIWGVSYGGFMTDMALFLKPGVFRAGAAWAAVNDWENYNAGYTEQRLNTPQSNPEAYRRSSPIHFSNNLQDKLLIVHGMVDDNVLFQDAVQLTEKLIHEGKDFEHIFYPEESHGFVRDETWIDALRRTTEWFDRFLQ